MPRKFKSDEEKRAYYKEEYQRRKASSHQYYLDHIDEIHKRHHKEYERSKENRLAKQKARYTEKHDEIRQGQRAVRRQREFNYLDPQYDWSQVEGYDGWKEHTVVHHRREGIGYSPKELKEQGQYYNCRPDELICVSISQHMKIHAEINKFFGRYQFRNKEKQTTL